MSVYQIVFSPSRRCFYHFFRDIRVSVYWLVFTNDYVIFSSSILQYFNILFKITLFKIKYFFKKYLIFRCSKLLKTLPESGLLVF